MVHDEGVFNNRQSFVREHYVAQGRTAVNVLPRLLRDVYQSFKRSTLVGLISHWAK